MIVKAGLDVVMKCAATGVPEPTISWFKEGQELEDNNKYEV